MAKLPVIGACVSTFTYGMNRDWLRQTPDGGAMRDVELQDLIAPGVMEGDWPGLVGVMAKVLEGHEGRIGLHGPFYGFELDTRDMAVREIAQKRLLDALSACETLGASHMVIHSPMKAWDSQHFPFKPKDRTRMIERTCTLLEEPVRRAQEIGCILVVENIDDTDPSFRRNLIEQLDSPSLRVSLDTGHALMANGAFGAPPVDAFIADAGEALAHVHLQDADGQADRHWPCGEGILNWRHLFAAMNNHSGLNRDDQTRPRLVLELEDHGKIKQAGQYLKEQGLAL